ncbi:MAG: hypothetical protein V4671_03645 [Armatimonadota bacterium]
MSSANIKPETQSRSDENGGQNNGLTDEQVKQLLAAAGRRKDDPGYIERLVEGAADYRRSLKEQESQAAKRTDK